MYKMGILLVIMVIGLIAMGCDTVEDDRRVSQITQENVMDRAIKAVPPYIPNAFPAREDINWYLTETETRDTWYIYALNKDGLPIFYIVSDMKPRNLCTSITAPDRRVYGSSGSVALSAPALDGVYYGTTNCGDTYYFRDVTTGNFVEIAGQSFTLISSKYPLNIETDPLGFIAE